MNKKPPEEFFLPAVFLWENGFVTTVRFG